MTPTSTRLLAAVAVTVVTACATPSSATQVTAAPTSATTGTAGLSTSTGAVGSTVPSLSAPATSASAASAPASLAAAERPLTGRTIVIDPGHNGRNAANPKVVSRLVDIGNGRKRCDSSGTQSNAGYAEHAFTWDMANRLAVVLRARGATVVLTRPSDAGVGPCITERAAIGNRNKADAAISIHADGAASTGYGFHVIAPGRVGANASIVAPSGRLALAVRAAYARGTGEPYSTYTGGGKAITVRKDLGGLNLSRVPKVFIECANMRNAADAARLRRPAWRQKAAQSLADGLTDFVLAERARRPGTAG